MLEKLKDIITFIAVVVFAFSIIFGYNIARYEMLKPDIKECNETKGNFYSHHGLSHCEK